VIRLFGQRFRAKDSANAMERHPNELRRQLGLITENGRPESHRALIEALRVQSQHTIEMLTTTQTKYGFNCVMYALGLIDHEEYVDFAMACPESVHASPDFIRFLIENRHVSRQPEPSKHDLIVYLNAGQVRHIGRLHSKQRVRSKWGIGHLYEHGVFEVPLRYGDEVLFFRPISTSNVLDHFMAYASAKGIELER
jgi:hypothetical protein